MTRPTNLEEFNASLKKFKSAVKTAMQTARDCAEFALAHYKDHGDTFPLQALHDATPKDYGRRPALVRWAINFGNIKIETGTFKKDHNHPFVKDNADIDLDAAYAKPFWEFAPEKQVTTFTINDILKGIDGVFSRFENAESFKALTPTDQKKTGDLKAFWENHKDDLKADEESVAA